MSKDDYETWTRSDIANTLNTFDNASGVRSTTLIIENENNDADRKKIL